MHAVFKMNGRLYHLELLQGLWPSMLCSDSSDTFPRSIQLWKRVILWRLFLSWIYPLSTIIFKAWILKENLELSFSALPIHQPPVPVSLRHGRALAQSPRAGRPKTGYGSLKIQPSPGLSPQPHANLAHPCLLSPWQPGRVSRGGPDLPAGPREPELLTPILHVQHNNRSC